MDAAAWIGPVGDVWAAEWRRTDRSFAGLSPYLDAAILARAPEHGRAIDIGCGAGTTTIAVAEARPELSVIGIDLSPALVAIARERGSGCANIDFSVGAVEAVMPNIKVADLLFSRHGVMFFQDPVAGMAALRAAAVPGAWLVFSCFRDVAENGWASDVVAAVAGAAAPRATGYAPGPFGFADPVFVDGLADAAGWRAEPPAAVDFAYVAGEGADPIADAVGYFARIGPAAALLRAIGPADADAVTTRLRATIERHLKDGRVAFPAAAWLWSMRAV